MKLSGIDTNNRLDESGGHETDFADSFLQALILPTSIQINAQSGDHEPYLDTIKSTSPLDALRYILDLRFQASVNKIIYANKLIDQEKTSDAISLVEQVYEPINPLLLATAIGVSIVRNEDFRSFLQSYIMGLGIPDFDQTLLKIDETCNNVTELSEILDVEEAFIDAFISLGEEKIITNDGSVIPEDEPPFCSMPTIFDVYWGAWRAAKSIYEIAVNYGSFRAIDYGVGANSAIHNSREHYMWLLDKTNNEGGYPLCSRNLYIWWLIVCGRPYFSHS